MRKAKTVQTFMEESQNVEELSESSLQSSDGSAHESQTVFQLKRRLDQFLFVSSQKKQDKSHKEEHQSKLQREYSYRQKEKENKIETQMIQNNPEQWMLSTESGLYLVPYMFGRGGLFLGVMFLGLSFLLNKLSLRMYKEIYGHTIKQNKDRAEERGYVFNQLLIIHKNMKNNWIADYFFQLNLIINQFLQVKIYYYAIFVFPFIGMQKYAHEFYRIENNQYSYENEELSILFDQQYLRWCYIINYSFLLVTYLFIKMKYSTFLGYLKYVLVIMQITLSVYLIAVNEQPLGQSYFDFQSQIPIDMNDKHFMILCNDYFLMMFLCFKNNFQYIKQPKIFSQYYQIGILIYFIFQGIVGPTQIQIFIRCDLKYEDVSGISICYTSSLIQLVIYLMSIFLIANLACNIKNLLMFRKGINQQIQYLFGIKQQMFINIFQAFLFFLLMFSSIYNAAANNFFNYYIAVSGFVFELILPLYILAKLSLKNPNNKKYVRIVFILGTILFLLLTCKYLLFAVL